MKTPHLSLLLLLGVLLSGCASRYDILLNGNKKITGVSRPKLNKADGYYHFNYVDGREDKVKAMHVRSIHPQGEEDKEKQFFR